MTEHAQYAPETSANFLLASSEPGLCLITKLTIKPPELMKAPYDCGEEEENHASCSNPSHRHRVRLYRHDVACQYLQRSRS